MILGQFILDPDGLYHGTINAYGLPDTPIMLVPKESRDGNPYFEIVGDPMNKAFNCGVAFPKKKGNLDYIAVSLDSPIFPAPVHAALFHDKLTQDTFNLVWDRQDPKQTPTPENKPSHGQYQQRRSMGASAAP